MALGKGQDYMSTATQAATTAKAAAESAAKTAGNSGWHLSVQPAIGLWLIVLAAVVCMGLIVYLYQAQKVLVPRRTLVLLLLLRLALVLLLVLLLLRPALRWMHDVHSAGTLWLVLDRSQSMALTDPQGSRVAQLRWACQLGYISPQMWPDSADTALARLSILSQELSRFVQLQRRSRFSIGPAAEFHADQQFLSRLRLWRNKLQAVEARLNTSLGRQETAALRADMVRLQTLMNSSIKQVRETKTPLPRQTLPWRAMRINMGSVLRDLNAAATEQDTAFLASHAKDQQVLQALARVAMMTRSQLAQAILRHRPPTARGSFAQLFKRYRVRVVSFGAHGVTAGTLKPGNANQVLQSAMSSTAKQTNIAAGLEAVAQRAVNDRASSVVIVSDGRQNVGPAPAEIARLLAVRGTKVFTLVVGSDKAAPAATIKEIQAPSWIYKHSVVQATALIHITGLAGKLVKLEFLRGKALLASKVIKARGPDVLTPVAFKDHPPLAGGYRYAIHILPIPGVLNRMGTVRHFRVTVRRDKLQVLLVDSRPGWDYQYLVKYFSRNPRVHLQAILLHPVKVPGIKAPPALQAFPKNPSYLAQILPQTIKQWMVYNLIIVGDVPPRVLNIADQQAIVAAVKNRGAALVLIAGPHHMPEDYIGMPLQSLLPVQPTSHWSPVILEEQFQRGFVPQLTAEGLNSGFGQFGLTQGHNARLWRDMPRWYWHSRQTDIKPAARVLWAIGDKGSHVVPTGVPTKHRALLATMSVGSGRVLYLASDESWRLRQVGGDNLQNVLWSQVLRWAVGSQLPAGGRYVRFGLNHHAFRVGRVVRVRARVLGENLLPETGLTFRAIVRKIPAAGNSTAPVPGRVVTSAKMIGVPGSPGFYEASISGLPSGHYQLTLRGQPVSLLLKDDPTATVRSLPFWIRPRPDLEMLDTASDPAQMRRIAAAGNGIALPGPYAALLARQIPNLKRTLHIPEQSGFFGNPHSFYTKLLHFIFLIIFTLVVMVEWIIRKRNGIV
jgi:hypothetical protein